MKDHPPRKARRRHGISPRPGIRHRTASRRRALRENRGKGSKTDEPYKPIVRAVPPSVKGSTTQLPVKKGDTNWINFQGHIKSGAQSDASQDGPKNYRDLVNRYFEELARQGNKGK